MSFISHISFSPVSATITATIPSIKTVFIVKLLFPTSANTTVISRGFPALFWKLPVQRLKFFSTHQQQYAHILSTFRYHWKLSSVEMNEGCFFEREINSTY